MLLVTLLHFFLIAAVCARSYILERNETEASPPGYVEYGHLFGISSDSPLSAELHREKAAGVMYRIQHHLTACAARVNKSMHAKAGDRDTIDDVCNMIDEYWSNNVRMFLKLRDTDTVDLSCITEHVPSHPREFVSDVLQWRDISRIVMPKFAERALGNWSDPQPLVDFQLKGDFQRCTINYLSAFRKDMKWYILGSATNAPITWSLGHYKRQYLDEMTTAISPTELGPSLGLNVYERSKDSSRKPGFTTTLASWAGRPTPSSFGTKHAAMLSVGIEGLRHGHMAADLADDTLRPSNIAILTIPLLMNFIPAALVSDMNILGTMLYILATDIISSVPVGIKGVELIKLGREKHTIVYTRFAGGSDNGFGDAISETRIAECGTDSSWITIGRILLAVALLFSLFGISLEFVARSHVRKRSREVRDMSLARFLETPRGREILKNNGASSGSLWRDETSFGVPQHTCPCGFQGGAYPGVQNGHNDLLNCPTPRHTADTYEEYDGNTRSSRKGRQNDKGSRK